MDVAIVVSILALFSAKDITNKSCILDTFLDFFNFFFYDDFFPFFISISFLYKDFTLIIGQHLIQSSAI